MGAVTVAPEFGRRMGYMDASGTVTKPTLQGGIAAMYYWYVSSEMAVLGTEMTDIL